MIRPVSWMLLFLAALSIAPSACAAARGEILYQAGFEEPDCLRSWEGVGSAGVEIVPGRGDSKALRVDRPAAEGPGYRSVRVRLPVEKLRGARVKVEGLVKAEGVARPPHPWNGVKCMLHSVSPSGPRWAQQDNVFGTFDWKPVRFTAEVPADSTEAWLVLGLEQTTGRAWFDDVKIAVIGHRRKVPAARPAGPVYKGHDLPRLRGAMISPQVTEADLRVLGGQWGANHVRWQLLWGGFPHGPADSADVAAYDRWLESALAHLDRLLPVCREVGIRVVIDMHTPPGGRNPSSQYRMFTDKQFQEAFVADWEKIARRYRGDKTVWGFDLVNEPVEGVVAEGLLDWHGLATLAARKVRGIDPDHAIIIEPAPWGGPEGLDWLEPLDVPGVVYSVHMYAPFQFTHQGIHGNPKGVVYPGTIQGKRYDRRELERVLRPAIDYQRDYGVHVYLGEFSAIRWAPGESARDYLRDCIDIFEEHGWDWAYHAFREWDGWSVEHGPDPEDHSRTATPTSRQQLLRSWYAKNRK
jgi:endoglucanase